MGTPDIAARVLSSLLDSGFQVVALISNEDKEIGRKHLLEATPTKLVALAHGIKVFQPHRIRLDHDFLNALNADLIVTMAYGQIFPVEVLKAPRYGCLNLHGSLLPKFRGAAPIQRAIMAGEKETGVTLMEMTAEMDAGRMFDKAAVRIEPEDNYTSLSHKIANAASSLIVRDLLPYLNGELKGVYQDLNAVTFAPKILPADEHLPLSLSAKAFNDYVRGLSLTPGGYLLLDGHKLKVYAAHLVNDRVTSEVGRVLSAQKQLIIQGQDGEISLDLLQAEGKKALKAADFLNGAHNLEGKILA